MSVSEVPIEFIGRARAFRSAAVARHAEAVAATDRLAMPLQARFRLRQAPGPGAYARVARAWPEQVPAAGRLDIAISATPARLAIVEIRTAPGTFRFDGWGAAAIETVLVVGRMTLRASPGRFVFDPALVAAVPLRALARRYQRGFDNTDAAIRADLRALAMPAPEILDQGGEFTVPLADGCWVGEVAEIEQRGAMVRVLVVRTYLDATMRARPGSAGAVLAEAAA